MTNSYNVSFSGGFWIKKPSPDMWNSIKESLPKKKVVLDTFNEEGDKFFAIKTAYDKEMAFTLLGKKIKKGKDVEKVDFKFYPDINLKVRIDSYYPEEAKKTINAQSRVLEDTKEIRKYFRETTVKSRPILKYRWKPDDHIEQTLKALSLQKEDCKISIKDGITIIKDKTGRNTIAVASPNSDKGFNYVYRLPQKPNSSSDSDAERIAVSHMDEQIHPFGVLDYQKFKECFMRAVKIDKGRKRPHNT